MNKKLKTSLLRDKIIINLISKLHPAIIIKKFIFDVKISKKKYLEMIKNVNNKVKYVSMPKVDHNFRLDSKIGKGKAFNGCSNNIVIRYFDGTRKHMDGTLTSRNEARKKCMTNKAGFGDKTNEKLDEAIEIALNFIDKNN